MTAFEPLAALCCAFLVFSCVSASGGCPAFSTPVLRLPENQKACNFFFSNVTQGTTDLCVCDKNRICVGSACVCSAFFPVGGAASATASCESATSPSSAALAATTTVGASNCQWTKTPDGRKWFCAAGDGQLLRDRYSPSSLEFRFGTVTGDTTPICFSYAYMPGQEYTLSVFFDQPTILLKMNLYMLDSPTDSASCLDVDPRFPTTGGSWTSPPLSTFCFKGSSWYTPLYSVVTIAATTTSLPLNVRVRVDVTGDKCTYAWRYGEYGSCSLPCGGGVKTRPAACWSNAGDAGQIIYPPFDVQKCTAAPSLQDACNTFACQQCGADWNQPSLQCSQHGYCVDGATCVCQDSYSGALCEVRASDGVAVKVGGAVGGVVLIALLIGAVVYWRRRKAAAAAAEAGEFHNLADQQKALHA